MTNANPRPLSDVRVLDFSTTIAGPHCGRLLADMGADVIKVESPEGDLMRSRPVQRDGQGTMFGQLNAGKRSIVLDLKKPEAIAAMKKLVAKVDIVLENYRPGVMKRLGLDYPELAKINPRLIYGAISGYGQTGPGGGPPGLRAGDPCLDRLRPRAPLLPAGPRAAGQLRHLRRRLRLGRLCAGRHPGGAASARRHRQGPDGRRLDVRDAGRHAAGRGQSRAVRFRDAVAADVRPGRGQGRLRHARDGEREDLPGHGDRGRPARLADRSALREIPRPPHELGPVRRRVRAAGRRRSPSRNASPRWRSTACPARPISP